MTFIRSSSERFHIACLCITLEPLRALHSRFMHLPNKVRTHNAVPGLLTEVNKETSTVHMALQYYATLLAGRCSRLLLVWRWQGGFSLLEWIRDTPEKALLLRRIALAAMSEVPRLTPQQPLSVKFETKRSYCLLGGE